MCCKSPSPGYRKNFQLLPEIPDTCTTSPAGAARRQTGGSALSRRTGHPLSGKVQVHAVNAKPQKPCWPAGRRSSSVPISGERHVPTAKRSRDASDTDNITSVVRWFPHGQAGFQERTDTLTHTPPPAKQGKQRRAACKRLERGVCPVALVFSLKTGRPSVRAGTSALYIAIASSIFP